MSIPVQVNAYSGYRASERPLRFSLDEDTFEITDVRDRWYSPDAEFFKVQTTDAHTYVLRHDWQADSWSLESALDGAQLQARPRTEIVSVHPAAITRAVGEVAACEHCAPEIAEILFDWILADVLGKRGPYEFVMAEEALCPACSAAITEKTLVEPAGRATGPARCHLRPEQGSSSI